MLIQIVTSFGDEVGAIRQVFRDGHAAQDVQCGAMPYCPLDDGCVVSLWDAWNRFMRALYLTSAAGDVTGIGGEVYLPTTARDEPDALTELRAAGSIKGSGIALVANEPKWFLTSSVYDISACLGLSNGSVIADALTQADVMLGGGFRIAVPLVDIRKVRNYIAHKSSAAADDLLCLMAPGVVDLSGYLRETSRGGATRFDDWSDALIGLAWDAAL